MFEQTETDIHYNLTVRDLIDVFKVTRFHHCGQSHDLVPAKSF
jgi:hypothetical protein